MVLQVRAQLRNDGVHPRLVVTARIDVHNPLQQVQHLWLRGCQKVQHLLFPRRQVSAHGLIPASSMTLEYKAN